jgi:hypothetical protein
MTCRECDARVTDATDATITAFMSRSPLLYAYTRNHGVRPSVHALSILSLKVFNLKRQARTSKTTSGPCQLRSGIRPCISRLLLYRVSSPVSTVHSRTESWFDCCLDRDQTQIEPFSPRHNVVVGRNGSGKSNFFAGELIFYKVIRDTNH